MRKAGIVVAVAGALLLSGCSTVQAVEQAEVAAPTAAPITMAPATTPAESLTDDEAAADEGFVASIDYFWQGEKPTEDAWIAAGHLACDSLASGTTYGEVVVVSGTDESIDNNTTVVQYATQYYCPEFRQG